MIKKCSGLLFLVYLSPEKPNPMTTMSMILKFRVSYLPLAAFLVCLSLTAFPPDLRADEPEEEKLENPTEYENVVLLAFFDANREISAMQRESQERIAEVVSEHGLTMERFNQIGRAAQIGALQAGAFTPEEIEAFNNVAPKVTQIQRETQGMFQGLLADFSMTPEFYQEILNEFRRNQEMQEYVREIARERAVEAIREERRREREREAQQEGQEEEGGEGEN